MSVTLKGYSSLKISGINLTSVQKNIKIDVLNKVFDKMVFSPVKTMLQAADNYLIRQIAMSILL